MVSKRWESARGNPRLEDKLAVALQLRPLEARLLANRGHTTIEGACVPYPHAAAFPRSLCHAWHGRGGPALVHSLHVQEPMVIYGDYDVDGITATAVLSWFFVISAYQCLTICRTACARVMDSMATPFEACRAGHTCSDHS